MPSASLSGISMLNSSSIAMTTSTVSKESRPIVGKVRGRSNVLCVVHLVETLEQRHDAPLNSLLLESAACAVHPYGLEGDCADNVDANGAGGDGEGRGTGGHARGTEESGTEHDGRLGARRLVVVVAPH